MLLNLVKIRYGDAPAFLDVGQIVAGYSFQRNLNAFATVPVFNGTPPSNVATGTFGLRVGFDNDSPTVTYSPLAGERCPLADDAGSTVGHHECRQAGFPSSWCSGSRCSR
jgi:hypothetical protein